MGFDQLLPLTLFNDESKGYLIDDCCIFGVEIFVIKHTSKGECLSLMKQPVHSTFTWSIQNFSSLDRESCKSQVFATGGHKWYVKLKEMLCNQAGGPGWWLYYCVFNYICLRRALLVYPKGNSTFEGKSLSIFLTLEDSETLPSGRTMYAEFTLRVRDQLFGKHLEKNGQLKFLYKLMFLFIFLLSREGGNCFYSC